MSRIDLGFGCPFIDHGRGEGIDPPDSRCAASLPCLPAAPPLLRPSPLPAPPPSILPLQQPFPSSPLTSRAWLAFPWWFGERRKREEEGKEKGSGEFRFC